MSVIERFLAPTAVSSSARLAAIRIHSLSLVCLTSSRHFARRTFSHHLPVFASSRFFYFQVSCVRFYSNSPLFYGTMLCICLELLMQSEFQFFIKVLQVRRDAFPFDVKLSFCTSEIGNRSVHYSFAALFHRKLL